MLGKPTGWANQSNELAWANRAKPCETSYSSRPYIHVHPGRIAFCGAKRCKCPFRVWGPRETKRVGRTSIKPKRVGRASIKLGLGEPASSPAGVDRVSKPSKASSVKLRLVTVFFGGSGRSQRLEAWQAASAGCFFVGFDGL